MALVAGLSTPPLPTIESRYLGSGCTVLRKERGSRCLLGSRLLIRALGLASSSVLSSSCVLCVILFCLICLFVILRLFGYVIKTTPNSFCNLISAVFMLSLERGGEWKSKAAFKGPDLRGSDLRKTYVKALVRVNYIMVLQAAMRNIVLRNNSIFIGHSQ